MKWENEMKEINKGKYEKEKCTKEKNTEWKPFKFKIQEITENMKGCPEKKMELLKKRTIWKTLISLLMKSANKKL